MKGLALIALTIAGLLAPFVRAADDPTDTEHTLRPVTPHQVESALRKAKQFLYSRQMNGNWEDAPEGVYRNDNSYNGGQWGGITALATYALLAAGENPQDPKMAQAIDFLKKADSRGVYALGLRMQVWLLLPPTPEIKKIAQADVAKLIAMTRSEGSARGMSDYTALGHLYSHSRTQYQVLGLWAGEQMGLEVPLRYWSENERAWIAHQDPSGGWSYTAPGEAFSRRGGAVPVTPGMTAAGVASLFITQDYVRAAAGAECRGNLTNPAIDRGVAWLANNFDKVATDERYDRDFPFATLYAVERVGVAGGLKYFGTIDWYAKGAAWLVAKQLADGSFGDVDGGSGPLGGMGPLGPPGGFRPRGRPPGMGGGRLRAAPAEGGAGTREPGDVSRIADASFAMLFLARGRAPVAVNKLDYSAPGGKPAPWNQRPRDVANAVRWVGRQLELDLNWQVVNLSVSAEELMEAPIVYLAGNQPVVMSNEDVNKLRTYVEMGGLIVANADCNSTTFAGSIHSLAERMFPAYPFRELPADDPLYHNLFSAAKWKQKPQVQAASNGDRNLILLLSNGDPARLWQTRAVKGREEPWELAANIFRSTFESRATLRFKGETHLVTPRPDVVPTRFVSLARLEYKGNWDPEPAGWRRLSAIMHNDFALDLKVDAVKLGAGKLASYKIAHLTGTGKLPLDAAAKAELRAFVKGGGRLIIDAAGGSGEFVEAAEALLAELFPDSKPRLLPPDHPWYAFDGRPIPIDYRAFARRTLVSNLKTGRLQAVTVDDRLAIVFSREDLSAGLVGQDFDGILGYTPETATRLMARQILSVAPPAAPTEQTTRPTTAPTPTPTTRPANPLEPAPAAARPAQPPAISHDGAPLRY
jgi:hypothetical protein